MKKQYKGILFLKDKKDKKLLKPGTFLYGQVVDSIQLVFLTPYRPPVDSIKMVGVVQSEHNWELQSPLLINVCFSSGQLTGRSYFNDSWHEFPLEFAYSSSLYERTPFKQQELGHLSNSRVLIFGCGTGGCKIGMQLAEANVGHITLCDPDRLEFANISRHEGNLLDVGKYKTDLLAERIYYKNPSIEVACYPEDIFERDYEFVKDMFQAHDLVIAATDVTAVQLQINEIVQRIGVPCVLGGCFEEALGGEVFFTLPDEKMPCLCCLRGGMDQPERNSQIDYSTASGSDDYQGQPGLHAMVDFVTCTEVLICLGILLRKIPSSKLGKMINPENNYLLIGGILSKGFYRFKKPFDIFYQPLKGPRKNCSVCQEASYVLDVSRNIT